MKPFALKECSEETMNWKEKPYRTFTVTQPVKVTIVKRKSKHDDEDSPLRHTAGQEIINQYKKSVYFPRKHNKNKIVLKNMNDTPIRGREYVPYSKQLTHHSKNSNERLFTFQGLKSNPPTPVPLSQRYSYTQSYAKRRISIDKLIEKTLLRRKKYL